MAQILATPAMLWALAILPALAGLAFWSRRQRRSLISRLGPPGVIVGQFDRGAGRWQAFAGWLLGLFLLVVGMAGPRWGLGPSPPTTPGRDIVAVVDLSRSMLAQDTLPSRLGKAKGALRAFADAVQARGGHRLALVAFAGEAAVVCPLTNDYDHFRAKVAALSADPPPVAVRNAGPNAVSGTRIGAGLQRAVAMLAADPQFRGAQGILLFSDGDDPARDEEWRTGLAAAREAGIPVDVVGIGDPRATSPIPTATGNLAYQGAEARTQLQEAPLREIAERTGGEYLAVRTGPPRDAYVIDRVATAATREAVTGTLPQPTGRQTLFLGIALALIAATMIQLNLRANVRGMVRRSGQIVRCLRRPAAAAAAIALVGATPPAEWLCRGNEELAAGRPEAALAEFARAAGAATDPGRVAFNEGVALFRLGRFRDAELHFRRCLADAAGNRRTRALYNLGCSLLEESQGRMPGPLRSAVAAFEQSFADMRLRDPVAEDLRHNLELAKRLLAAARTSTPNQPQELADDRQPGRPPSTRGGPDDNSSATVGEPGTEQKGSGGEPLAKGKTDGARPQATELQPPGKGHLPPLPDEDVLTPLSPEDARAHLAKAAARIAAERTTSLKSMAPAVATRFPEW